MDSRGRWMCSVSRMGVQVSSLRVSNFKFQFQKVFKKCQEVSRILNDGHFKKFQEVSGSLDGGQFHFLCLTLRSQI